MPAITLDLTQRHFTKSRGIITAIGTWIHLGSSWEPCLVLVRTGEEADDATQPCIITLSKAWVFEETIGDGAQAARILYSFLAPLRLSASDPHNVFRLHSLVHDHLGDFLAIPPYPPGSDNRPIDLAELTITDHRTGRTMETVLTDV